MVAVALGIFTTRWLVAYLSPDQYAIYNYILSYDSVVLAVITLGIPNIIQKIYTNKTYSKSEIAHFWTTMAVFRLASYFVGLIIILFTYKLSQTDQIGYIIGIYTSQFILIADLSFRSVTDSLGRSWQFSLTDFIGKFILVVLLYLSVYLGINDKLNQSLSLFIYCSAFTYVVSLLLDLTLQREHTPFGLFKIDVLKDHSKAIFLLSLSGFITSLYFTTDKLFLGYYTGSNTLQIGSYSTAYKIFEVASIIPGLTMPVYASNVKKQLDNLADISKKVLGIKILKATLVATFVGLCITVGIWIFSSLGLRIIDLRVLAIGITFLSPVWLLSNLIVFLNGEKYEFLSTIIAAITGLTLYVIWIPRYELIGAAWATVFTLVVDFMTKSFFAYIKIKNFKLPN
jgi:O-antigen/teichoic acid export membrane protein